MFWLYLCTNGCENNYELRRNAKQVETYVYIYIYTDTHILNFEQHHEKQVRTKSHFLGIFIQNAHRTTKIYRDSGFTDNKYSITRSKQILSTSFYTWALSFSFFDTWFFFGFLSYSPHPCLNFLPSLTSFPFTCPLIFPQTCIEPPRFSLSYSTFSLFSSVCE